MTQSIAAMMKPKTNNPLPMLTFERNRDVYGFAVRPQHLHRYREYASIYKEEEKERSDRWDSFLERLAESAHQTTNDLTEDKGGTTKQADVAVKDADNGGDRGLGEEEDSRGRKSVDGEDYSSGMKTSNRQGWAHIRRSFTAIENTMSIRVNKKFLSKQRTNTDSGNHLDLKDQTIFHFIEELEVLVHGGVPVDLRGEMWQAFVGVSSRRDEKYYESLLSVKTTDEMKGKIKRILSLTFPGHPALDEDGRNAFSRLLTAYAMHNPSVGYCQEMNFFAGLLLLLMPEENAFWALLGIIDDYFEGYHSEEMIEAQLTVWIPWE